MRNIDVHSSFHGARTSRVNPERVPVLWRRVPQTDSYFVLILIMWCPFVRFTATP